MSKEIEVRVGHVQRRRVSPEFGFHGLERLFRVIGIEISIAFNARGGSLSSHRQQISTVCATNRGHGICYILKPGTRPLGLQAAQQDQEVAGQVGFAHGLACCTVVEPGKPQPRPGRKSPCRATGTIDARSNHRSCHLGYI